MRRWQLWLASVVVSVGLLLGGASLVSAQQPPGTGLGLGSAGSAPTTCSLEGVGWIVCPVLISAAKAADYAFTFVSQSFLGLEIELFNRDSGTRQAWGVMLNVANVSFVIALLWVIYAHLSGHAAGAYNIKRMLPRLIIGVILVQASFLICQLLVDVSNVLGASLNSLFAGVTSSIGQSGMPLSTTVGNYNSTVLTAITGSLLGNTQVAWVLLAPLAAIVLLAALICSVTIVILIVRKTLVMALILLSPLAFVAYLLPSTEHLFSRWLKLFGQTLLLFPIIAILLGTGQIVSASIIKAGNGASGYKVQGDEYVPVGETADASATLRLVAAGSAILPLAGTWWAFKAAMSGFDAAAMRVKSGARRGTRRKPDNASKREQAARVRTSQTMMQKGLTRIQQLSNIQDTRDDNNIGALFGNRRPRKKTAKSPEQTKFDNQVQDRLNGLRDEANAQDPPISPQLMYSQALQRFNTAQDKLGPDEELDLNSPESIDLKASEAFLLESIAKHPADQQTTPSAIKTTDAGGDDADNSKKEDTSNKPDPGSHMTPRQAPSTPLSSSDSEKDFSTAAAASLVGVPIIVQSGEVTQADSAGASSSLREKTTSAAKLSAPNNMETEAKARAAKYVAQAQESLLDEDAADSNPINKILNSKEAEPTPALQKINELSSTRNDIAKPAANTTSAPRFDSMPSTLRAAESSVRGAPRIEDEAARQSSLRITHDNDGVTDRKS